jgi:hypothetical protein
LRANIERERRVCFEVDEQEGVFDYAIAVERMTGKEHPLPPLSEQWPAIDRTKTPNARLPADGL